MTCKSLTILTCSVVALLAMGAPAGADESKAGCAALIEKVPPDHGYLSNIVDLGFLEPGERTVMSLSFGLPFAGKTPDVAPDPQESYQLIKWVREPRIIIASTERITPDLTYAIVMFYDGLKQTTGRSDLPAIVWNPSLAFSFADGDLLIVLAPDLELVAQDERSEAFKLTRKFFALEEDWRPTLAKIDGPGQQGFVQLLGKQHTIDRAVVFYSTKQLSFIRRHDLFKLLTFSIHPRPASLQGSPPLYNSDFEQRAQFDLAWTPEFRTFLALALSPTVAPGLNRAEFMSPAGKLLERPDVRKLLQDIWECN